MENELYNKAMTFFHDAQLTEKWLNHPCPFFNNATPRQLFTTEHGRKAVLDYLDRCLSSSSEKEY